MLPLPISTLTTKDARGALKWYWAHHDPEHYGFDINISLFYHKQC